MVMIILKRKNYKNLLQVVFVFLILLLISVQLAGADYSSTILGESSLVSYWRLNETSGTSAHDSKGSNDGTISSSGVLYGQTGLLGTPSSCMHFDGSSGRVVLPAGIEISEPLTLEGWVKPDSGVGPEGTVGTNAYGLELNGNNGNWHIYQHGGSVEGAATYNKGVYFALTSATNFLLSLYIGDSGSVSLLTSGNPGGFSYSDTSGSDAIGYSSFHGYFKGCLQDVALYNTVLSSTQMTNHYNAGTATPTPTPTPTPTSTPTPTPTQSASATTSLQNVPPANPNSITGWNQTIMAGPHFVGTSQFISGGNGQSFAQTLIPHGAVHDDISVAITPVQPVDLLLPLDVIPFPWEQGLNTAGDIFKYSAVSAFNGYPIQQFDKPVIITLPYDSAKLANVNTYTLSIAFYDPLTKTWKMLPNCIVNTKNHTLATTVTHFSYFTIVYPSKTFTAVSTTTNVLGEAVSLSSLSPRSKNESPSPFPTMPESIPHRIKQTKSTAQNFCLLFMCW